MQTLSSVQDCFSGAYTVASSTAETCAVTCKRAARVVNKVGHSIVGQVVHTVIKSAIRENVAEFVGTFLASKVVIQVSSSVSSVALAALPTVATIASHYIGVAPLVTIVALGAGILGGYVGVRLTGSREPLLNPVSPLHCYTTKALQASALAGAVDLMFSPAPGVITFVGNLALEGLAFNAVDIGNFIRALINKQALDQVLPAHLDKVVVGELSKLIETMRPSLSRSLPIRAAVVEDKQIRDKILSKLFTLSMKLFNQYSELLSTDEAVRKAQTNFDDAFNKFYQETDLEKKIGLRAQFDAKKGALQALLQELLAKDMKKMLPAATETESSNELLFESFKEFVKKIQTVHIDDKLAMLMAELQNCEERVIGVSLTGERERCYIKECLAMCLNAIIELALFCYAKTKDVLGTCTTLPSDEIKKVYVNLNKIIFHHYQTALGKRAAMFLKNTLEQQIMHSNLA